MRGKESESEEQGAGHGGRGTDLAPPALLVPSADARLSGRLPQKCVATMKIHTCENSEPSH